MVYALVNSQLQQIRANFWKKKTQNQHSPVNLTSAKKKCLLKNLGEKSILTSSKTWTLKSRIGRTLLGVSNQDKTQALNYLSYSLIQLLSLKGFNFGFGLRTNKSE